ncbi:MAG TPA: translesion DNA synthesis-associated protein ImuA [Accumulibacter sp.]|nr:translesion DNA synthesis-associated protein ImuA [Accumulibacter sp.]HQC79603.1 translesion DNA synthesis-associated protein ImuA [Accumulibacter sp.]
MAAPAGTLSPPTLRQILERPDVWRGDALAGTRLPGVPTGFAELDGELPGGGWPRGGLIELLPICDGVGELSLLLPALARVSNDELSWLVCIAPPYSLHAPAWSAGGVDLSRLLVAGASGHDAAWACERSLVAEGVGAVVAWLPDARSTVLRRLQLAAENSRTLLFVFRPALCASQPSPASLRLLLAGEGDQLRVRLLKRRGNACATPVLIAVQRPVPLGHALAGSSTSAPAARRLSQSAVA